MRVLDFGLASTPDWPSYAEGSTGTPGYAPPEQVEHKKADPRSDVFGAGATTYKLLTGLHPYDELRDHRVPCPLDRLDHAYMNSQDRAVFSHAYHVALGPVDIDMLNLALKKAESGLRLTPNEVVLVQMSSNASVVADKALSEFQAHGTYDELPERLARVVDKSIACDRDQRWQSALAMSEALDQAMQRDAVTTEGKSSWVPAAVVGTVMLALFGVAVTMNKGPFI